MTTEYSANEVLNRLEKVIKRALQETIDEMTKARSNQRQHGGPDTAIAVLSGNADAYEHVLHMIDTIPVRD